MGVAPERLAQQLAQNNQLNFAAAEVVRAKAMNLIAERVKVTDPQGEVIDVAAALAAPPSSAAFSDDADEADDIDDADDIDEAAEVDDDADVEAGDAGDADEAGEDAKA
jgi:hypothetical protein